MFHGNWIDAIIIVFVLFSMLEAWRRGFIVGLLDLFGFSLSFLAGLKYYQLAAMFFTQNFSFPKGISDAIGFFVVAFIAEVLFAYIFSFAVYIVPKRVLISRTNRFLGIIPPILTALITASFILTIALSLPIRGVFKSAITRAKIGSFLISNTHGIERALSNVFDEAIYETLNFLTVPASPASSDYVQLRFTQSVHTVDRAAEQEMMSLINHERALRGILPLKEDKELVDLSRSYASNMFEKGYFSHHTLGGQSPFDRMENAGIFYTAAGENLALAPTVAIAHKGLMKSRGHRENILSDEFGRVGIGVIDGGVYGKMFVQEFTD